MIQLEEIEAIRRAYFLEGLSIREIARQHRHGRPVIRKAIASPKPAGYKLKKPRPAPVLEPFKERIDELWAERDEQPRKQRYTARKIFQMIQAEGYPGSEVTVRRYVRQQRERKQKFDAYLPLEFDPGQDAQMDWGEAVVDLAGERITVQLFVMRLNYSKARFVMAFPFQKQEAFFEGHIQAFHFFGGVPRRIAYDNLKTAVYRILEGRNRQEQQAFVAFRSYYLFESHYCTPAQAHEKGGVESDVGYGRRNFLVPIPAIDSFGELNHHLRQACLRDTQRRVRGEKQSVAHLWAAERPQLLPLPASDYPACSSRPVKVNPYSQVAFETNRYSVPADYVGRQLVLRAFPFRIEILAIDQVIAAHPRCFGREQDVLDPLHYLPLLEQRPGAFEHAKPIRRWRKSWSPVYERLLDQLRTQWPNGRGVREFVRILKLHRDHPVDLVSKAVEQALSYGCAHADGVQLCLRQLVNSESPVPPIDLNRWPQLVTVGSQAPDLQRYNRLLGQG